MFGIRLNKKEKHTANEDPGLSSDARTRAFEMLVLTYLEYEGYDKTGNKTAPAKILNQEEFDIFDQTLKALDFSEHIKVVILNEWAVGKAQNTELTPLLFARKFVSEFHNLKMEPFAPDWIKTRNINFIESYKIIIQSIEKIQGALEDDGLRIRVESNFTTCPTIQSTIYQCCTPFCILSLGCDTLGRYNLVYSVDRRLQEMISPELASTLIRRIHDFTPGSMEPFVRIGSLNADCVAMFTQLIEESKTEPYHRIVVKEKHKQQ